jgi:hypothetical protein
MGALLALTLALSGCSADDGAPGADGSPGDTGMTGPTGADGEDGASGEDGAPGIAGKDGADGLNGVDGVDGADAARFDRVLNAEMTGEMEAPVAVATKSSGFAKLALATASGDFVGSARVTFAATKVHVHGPAFAGETGPVLFEMEQDPHDAELWRIPAGTRLSPDAVQAALTGALYVNAHSAANPTGEVRGQILGESLIVLRSRLDTLQEVPPPKGGTDDLGSSAIGYVTLDRRSGAVHASVRTSFVASKAHIHGPAGEADAAGIAGRTSGVFREMTLAADATPADDLWTLPSDTAPLTAAQLSRLLAGDFYFNAHTTANASGLVRGQIHAENVQVLRVPLDTEQEFPKPTGAASTGLGFLTVDLDNGRVRGDVTANGFTPTKAHIHAARIGQTGGVALEFVASAGNAARFSAPEVGFNGSLNGALDAAGLAALARGDLYLNMHSAANTAGEVRGQILPSGLQLLRVPMDSAQEIPAPVAAAGSSGLALLVVDSETGRSSGFGRVAGFTATAFHIHAGAAGATGAVAVEWTASATEPGKFDMPDNVLLDPVALASSGFYVNSHSTANPKGQVRGQIVLP